MKQFIYKPSDAGIANWPEGELRLEGIEITENAAAADVFVCPGNIRIFEGKPGSGILDIHGLNRLPYFKGNESRHVFFDCSDNFKKPINLPIIFIRCDVRTWMLPHDPNTIQMAWPVEDYGDCVEVPAGGFKYDVSFHGWDSHKTRIEAADSCEASGHLSLDFKRYKDFTGYIYHQPEGSKRRQQYRQSMRESRIMLCGESIAGVMPYRFYEAMSAGRVPCLVSSDYVLPSAQEIPYEDFIIRLESEDASKTGRAISRYIDQASDGELIERGKLARYYWQRFLDSKDWPERMAHAVHQHMAKVAV